MAALMAAVCAGTLTAQTRVEYKTVDDWGSGFQAQITIRNESEQALRGWAISFDFTPKIDSIWDAVVAAHQGPRYTIQSAGWNSTIAPHDSVIFGFIGSPGGLTGGPTEFEVTGDAAPPANLPVTPPVTGTVIAVQGVDDRATQLTVPLGADTTYRLSVLKVDSPAFRLSTNNSAVIGFSLKDAATLVVTGLSPGRGSLRIEETGTHTVRYIGVRVANADGSLPGLPAYLSIGSVSEDTGSHLDFWRQFSSGLENRRVDIRYIYLNGGPLNGWDTWSDAPGGRARDYIRNSRMLGMIPYFVFYNIPDSSESFQLDLAHAQDAPYMAAYFRNLALALEIINQESPDDTVGMILEPDFLGYLAQNANMSPSRIAAAAHAAFDSGVLSADRDPSFPDTVTGLVSTINYVISKRTPQVKFGWQFNLWASPAGGWTTPIPITGLMHRTEIAGIADGRSQIAAEAAAIANFYIQAGVADYGVAFVSIDKYGLDAAGTDSRAAQDPANSIWFWNNDLWQNYLTFVASLRASTGLPVVLWQMPAGHINSSTAFDPYDPSGVFPDLTNAIQYYEDSAPTFFFGDTFNTSGARYGYFSANLGGDLSVSAANGAITWGSHMQNAADSGVIAILFGAGVGASTSNVGAPPTDSFWWITRTQQYYQQPVTIR